MVIIKKRKIVLIAAFFLLAVTLLTTWHKKDAPVFSDKMQKRIIIDAGHGFPDGGAIGISGTIESTLNIKIANRLKPLLEKNGFSVIMTRKDENSLSSEGKTLSARKHNDMHKRLDIINNSSADIFVSVHMNKFSDSRYKGAQVLFSGNFPQSERLAFSIQNKLNSLSENEKKRTHSKAPGNIFLLKNAQIPAVIVECGFISNFEEEQLLLTENYQDKLAQAISEGIILYYKTEKEK